MRRKLAISLLLVFSVAECSLAFEEEVASISSELSAKIFATGKKTVAVVDLTDLEGKPNQLGRFLAEEVAAALVDTESGLRVINRTHLKSIMAENKLATTGLIDPQTAIKLGQITGVEVLVTGTTTDLGESVRVSIAALDSRTALTISSARVNIPRTRAIGQLLDAEVAPGGSRSRPNSRSRKTVSERKNSMDTFNEVGGFTFAFDRCSRSGAKVVCHFLVTSKKDDVFLYTFANYSSGSHRTRIFDDQGIEYPAKFAKLGASESASYTKKSMVSGVAIPASFSFEGLDSDATFIKVLQVGLEGPDRKYNFKIRDIVLED